ncbi:Ig-like domain-containing protein [Streptomyces sp. TLI_105]|uniref:L,D-transpeptidase family protein n=1 Tax=Streptomyces sp. TLI_105 TaxID=1881019 RepID=UPI00089472E2|nr:Ig-like domain-containing protein [Streptomyces sp. TLI_105]SED45114.1 Lipoprotein-anchoring transpeptidase ErfK/SrfK [Streptomyces sp. TLI_105]
MLPIRTSRPALAAVALAVSLTACTAQAADGGTSGVGSGASQAPPAKVTVVKKEAGSPVAVTATGGTLTAVKVVDAEGGDLGGRTDAGGTSWASDRKAAPGTSYTVEVTSRTADGKESTSRSSFTTPEPEKVNKVTLAPGKNTTVGIGQPLSIVFDLPVTRKADVERQLKVTTSNGTEGSWGWVKDYSGRDRVDWRPREYWKPGTKVTLEADLDGTDSGGGWFVRDYRTGFTVGAAQVVKVDLDTHRLTLERDGRTVRTIPVSGGTPGGDKRSWRGTAVLMAKEGTINMNSETVGLGDAYNKDVDYSMRLTWSGMYAHAAPWNAAYFGRANHSSGCIGMSDADAASFYASVNVGDPFEIKGRETKGTVAEGNGYGAWNLTWSAWKSKSALG